MRSRDLQRLGSPGRTFRGAFSKQNRRAAFGGNDRIAGVFLHQQPVANPEGQGAATPSFSNHRDNDGSLETGHFLDIPGNGFGLTALLSTNSGIGPLGINKAQHGSLEPFGEMKEAERLSIALGPGHAKIPVHFFGHRLPALMANHYHWHTPKTCQTADNCRIIAKDAIAVQLHEFGAQRLNIIERIGPVRVPRELHPLPR